MNGLFEIWKSDETRKNYVVEHGFDTYDEARIWLRANEDKSIYDGWDLYIDVDHEKIRAMSFSEKSDFVKSNIPYDFKVEAVTDPILNNLPSQVAERMKNMSRHYGITVVTFEGDFDSDVCKKGVAMFKAYTRALCDVGAIDENERLLLNLVLISERGKEAASEFKLSRMSLFGRVTNYRV